MKSYVSSIVYILLIALMPIKVYAADNVVTSKDPIYKTSFNGNFIWVGNTNTNAKDFTKVQSSEDEDINMELVNIKNKPTGDNTNYTNINYAEFCIPNIDHTCGPANIEFAQLNWVMGDAQTGYKKVTIIITDESGNIVSGTRTTITADREVTEMKITSCHADLKSYFENLYDNNTLENNKRYRIYVADIKANTAAAQKGYNNGSGWSLFIAYSHPLEERHTITYYDIDVLGETGQSGSVGKSIVCDFNLMENTKVVDESIKMGLSGFGSMFHIPEKSILVNNPDDRIRLPLGYTNAAGKNDDENAFRCSILYKYSNDCGDIAKDGTEYTRAFDLQVWAVKNDNYVKSGDQALKLTIQGDNENHFLTNAVLSFGTPDIPEAALPLEVDKKDIGPDESYKCKLYVTVGENSDGLKNIKVNIPLSEYIQYVDSFEIKFLNNDLYWPGWSDVVKIRTTKESDADGNAYLNDNNGNIFLSDVKSGNDSYNNKLYGTGNQIGIVSQINRYLTDIDDNEKKEFLQNPAHREARMITIDFDKLVIPSKIKNTDVIEITLKLHTKPKTDEVYRKTSYVGKPTSVVPQAELTTTTEKSNETSIFENTNREQTNTNSSQGIDKYFQNLKCSGGTGNGNGWGNGGGNGGAGGCSGIGGDHNTSEGILQPRKGKDGKGEPIKNVIINISAESNCPEVPDLVEVPFCNNTTIRPADIYQVLLHYYGLDIDSIAKVDSCIWEQHKRDALIDFAERHGVNRSRMMNLLGDLNALPSITSTAANYSPEFEGFLNCESKLSADSIDSIINMKIDYSKLLMLFASENTTDIYQTANYIDIGEGGEDIFNTNYSISETLETYAYFKSPWKKGSCNKYIKVKFIKMDTDAPVATYKGEVIQNGGKIYACKEETMKPIIIEKGHNNYDIYADIIDTINVSHPDIWINKNKRKDNPLKWELGKDDNAVVASTTPGEFQIELRKKDFLLNCEGDPLKFTLEIIDIQLKEKPKIKTETGEKKFCQVLDKNEKVKLFIENPDYEVRWFRNYEDENNEKKQDTLGIGESVEVNANVVGTFEYSAEYFKDQCSSQQDTIYIQIVRMADTLKTDTMVICQHYELTENDVINQIREWNGTTYDSNNLLFYEFDETYSSDTAEVLSHAIKQTPLALADLLKTLDYDSDCPKDKPRMTGFVVQAKSGDGCVGAGSVVPVKINCYEDAKPLFKEGIDSILYCTGDNPLTELNSYLNETDFDASEHKWIWASVADNEPLPKNYYKSNVYETRTSGKDPKTSTAGANTTYFAVARVDKNSCVSQYDTFRIVVADAIKTYPMVGDTTSVISTSRTDKHALNFCKGESPYKDKTIPTVGYPSRDYIMEWYRKDKLDDDCDYIADKLYERLTEKVDVDFDHVDTTYYCLRQTTNMGCKGPWLTVIVTVNDSVRETPAADTVTICEGATPQKFVVKTTQDKDLSLYTFLSKDSSAVASTNMVVDTTEGKYISTLKKNLYYGYYKNSKTGCMSETVGFNAIVNHKPHLPAMNEDTTLYLCANGETINLAEKIESNINTLDQHTKVVWEPKDEIVTSQNTSAAYYIHQVDTTTLCEGEKIEITVKVENTFKYKEFGQKDACFGESISLRDTVNRLLSSKNQIIDKEALGFKVFALHNKVKGVEIKAPVQSSKSRYLNDTTFYLIEILDTISGCSQTDTATVIFHGLPNETVDATLSMCQNVALELPTPTNADYTYVWRNGQGDVINGTPAKLILEADETISLTETDKLYGCEEKIEVDVTVYPTPDHAISADTSVCQNGKELKLEGQVNPTSDGYNTASNLSLQWFNEKKDSINNPIQTDTIALTELITDFKYTLRQTNSKTRCFKDTVITISLRKNIQLEMPDLDAVCEPEVINFVQKVDDYIFANIASTNLVNTNGLTFEYAKIVKNKAKKITADEASALTYTDQKDKVDYIYTVTDADKVCSTSDTVTVTINERPKTPLIEGGADTLFFCKDNTPIWLHALDTNADTTKTDIFWGEEKVSKDSIDISIYPSGVYAAYSKNILTGCKSDGDTLVAYISNSIEFKPFSDTIHVCHSETVNLEEEVETRLAIGNKNNYRSSIGYKIWGLIGTTPNTLKSASAIASKATKTQTDIQRFYIEVLDTVSGCTYSDTATIVFHELPTIDPIDPIVICQFQDTMLLAPTETYKYEWYREEGSRIPAPEKLQLETSEKIKLVAIDKDWSCEDSIFIQMDVKKIPEVALAEGDTFCQHSGSHPIAVKINASEDNAATDLTLKWLNSAGEEIKTPVNTDTIEFSGLSKKINYTIRQTNKATGCYKDTVIEVTINKALQLGMDDIERICQPDSIAFKSLVNDYLYTNASDINLPNVQGIEIAYARIDNGSAKKLTESQVEQLHYIEGRDSVQYIYTVTDAEKVCTASDTVFVTINQKPTVPLIEGGADTLFFCKDNSPIWLHALDTNADTTKTDIFWGEEKVSKDSIDISIYPSGVYAAYSKNILTGCKSDGDTLVAYISNSIEFKPFSDTIHVCHSETVNLEEEVEKRLAEGNKNNYRSSIGYKIWGLIGTTPNTLKSADAIASKAIKTQTDIQRFYIEVLDTVSGCFYSDTATIVFHELPTIDPIDPIVICQFQDTLLLAPTETYKYEWYREEGSRIPAPEKLQLETSEKIKLVAIDKDWSCEDSIFIQMDVRKIPEVAIAQGDTFCQHSGSHPIAVQINPSEDNAAADLTLKWLNSAGEEIKTPVNTDTIEFSGLSKKINYTIRQTNKATGCYKDTVIEVTINKALQLGMDDIERICQPDSIAFKSLVNDYLYTNASDINLPNVQGIEIAYARIDNGSAKKLTEEQVKQLHYIEGRDSVQYIYTVTDAEKVCTASDTVFVTINQKPTIPVIEGGTDTLFYCKVSSSLWLHALDTNADTTKTDIFWNENTTSSDSIDISRFSFGSYTAYSKNLETGCKSDADTIVAYISNAIDFKPFTDTIHVCHNETVNLEEEVEKRLADGNKNNFKSNIGYKIWGLIGTTPNSINSADALASKAVKTQTDIQRFYIEVLDSVSGCYLTDTATIVFHELPTIDPIDPIVICQFQDTLLLAPTETYKYEWFREEGSRIPAPEKLQLETSEKIKLVATDKEWRCVDSIFVQMDVRKIPEVALAEGGTFCQYSGTHPIEVKINASEDNAATDLSIKWLNSAGEEINTPVNTDTIEFSGLSKKINYTIRQTNKATGCYKDTVIEVTINKALQLAMDDIERICQPDSVAFKSLVNDYLYTNASKINLTNVQGIEIEYARIDNGKAVKLTEDQVEQLKYIDGRDSVPYIYTVTDAEKVCSVSDTVFVTINQKPVPPIIENGLDSIFFCGSLSEIMIGAKNVNPVLEETRIFWGEVNQAIEGDSLSISAKEKKYTAFTKNIYTECVSDLDSIVAVISDPIKVTPIGENGVIELCAGEHINVADTAKASFIIAERQNSNIVYNAKAGGNVINMDNLIDVSRAKQDTIVYEFSATDKLNDCEATNTLTLIFHDKPKFEIEGKKILCQGDELVLNAVGESRATSYTWQFDGVELIESSSDQFNKKDLMQDTVVLVVAQLDGTSCIDSVKQAIQINETPKKLADQTFSFCQDEKGQDPSILLERSEEEREKFSLIWYDVEENEFSNDNELSLSIVNDTVYNFFVKQENDNRGLTCYSELSTVTVNVNKHIIVSLRDTNICMPEKFNLAKYAKDKKTESVSGYRLNTERIFKIDGSDLLSVADSTQVEETGKYQIVYADKNNCETTAEVTLKFISKPEVPAFDETMPIYLCQGVDTIISPKFIAGDYEYIWDKIGSNETLISDTLKISAALSNGDKVAYNVWRRDTIYGCESEKAEISYQILDSIRTTPMETIHICESESVNLDSVAGLIFTSGNELQNSIYHSDEEQSKGSQLLYSNAVTDAGFYLIEAQDNVSGCKAKSLVEIATHAAPTILYKGETSLCDGSDVRLTAYPKEGEETPEYQWTNAEGKSIQDSVLTFTTTLEEEASEAKTESLELTGTYHITNKKACVSSETVEITTHPIPPTLPNDTIDICQNTGEATIYVEYQDNVFNLKRYDSEGNEIENTIVNTDNVTNVEFTVMQEDRITKCKGKGASIYVNVRQSIELHIDEQEEVCAPKTINLENVVNQAAYASNTEIPEKKVYEIKSITKNGIAVEAPNVIDQSGVYQVVIADQYGCEAGESVQLTVHQQPAPISGDTSFCQGTGIQTLAGKGETNDLILEWMDLSTAYPDSIFTDTLKVNTEKKGDKLYLIRQTTLSSHCSSEAAPMTITIHPAITPTLTDTMICFGETFDFVAFAERHVTEGVNPFLDDTRRTEPIMPIDYTAIKQAGSFIAHYTDANRCEASDTMTLAYAPKIEIELDYTKEICAGDTIKAKVSGAEHYIWNQASDDIDNISIATEVAGVQEIGLTASIVIQPTEGTSCSIDTTIQVQINKVPDLISGYGDTTYCQATPTEALTLQPTDENAMVLWYDPNDDYATVSKDGTLKPSSLYAGDFTYKFRQQLGECQTALQDYTVHIQSSIEEIALVSDTAYCKDELTAPLLAKWENPLYEVIWSDENDNPLEPGYKPSSATAGEQKYFARLSYKACQGEASTMRVTIQEKYDRKPDIDNSFIFCENTGLHTIHANSIDNGARLNWYTENSNERLDSIVINTNESNWKEATFYVTQSVINGCESPSTKFDVSIKDAIQPLSFNLDTCAGLTVTLDEIMAMQKIQEEADTLWNGTDKSQRMDLKSNIGYTGDYQFSVVNEFGCKATHTAHINMLKVEDLEYTSIKSIYCYDDSVSLSASASNADFEWENVTEGLNHYGKSYDFVLSGDANVTLTATIINKPVCKENIDFVFKTYDKTKAIINGETNICLGNTINLNTGNLYDTKWSIADSTIESDEFTFTPSRSEILTISGVDENQCPVDTTITLNTVKQPDPTIIVTPLIHSTLFHLNRDTFEVHLEASISSTLDENYSYKWDFGDGQKSYGNSVEDHEYEAALVRLTKPIDVTLTVEHAYGCAGEATTQLLVDPDFDVPNTMTPEDEFMEDYELQIFDRIGNLIYEGIGWHGQTNKGDEAFGDTYFYAITYFINGEKKIKTGYITLVR